MTPRLLLLLPLLALASCSSGGKSDSTTASSSTGPRTLTQRMNESNGYTRDSEGNWVPQTDRRSSFETNRKSRYFKGEYDKKEFKTADYQKKSWWGKEDYARKPYTGDTDGSRFQQSSGLQDQTSREAGTTARIPGPYDTGSYTTSAAREAGSTRLDRPSNAETEVRRRVFTPPSVIEWQAQREMSMDKSRGILGR